MNQSSVAKYYINPPYEARLVNESRRRGGEDWLSILGNAFTMEEGDYELVDITIRINPNDFGLIEGDAQQLAASLVGGLRLGGFGHCQQPAGLAQAAGLDQGAEIGRASCR